MLLVTGMTAQLLSLAATAFSAAADTRPVYVAVSDDTKARKPADGVMGFRVKGQTWRRLTCKYGGCEDPRGPNAANTSHLLLATAPVGSVLTLEVDDGQVVHSVPIKVTADLCPNDCARDLLQLRITDDVVRVFGGHLKAAGGKTFEVSFSRGKAVPGRWLN
jgi:hypothetical protein